MKADLDPSAAAPGPDAVPGLRHGMLMLFTARKPLYAAPGAV